MKYRNYKQYLKALFRWQYYYAVVKIFAVFDQPFWVLRTYLFSSNLGYPKRLSAKTASGKVTFSVYSPDDVVTAIECFARGDYRIDGNAKTIVDFGSNIGLSALYFLTQCPNGFVHLYEPVPTNLERLKLNLRDYSHRININACAVGVGAGTAKFGIESTGRYGGIGLDFPEHITVEVRDANSEITKAAGSGKKIDCLKIDVEGMEAAILSGLPNIGDVKIETVLAEVNADAPMLKGFSMQKRLGIALYKAPSRI